MQRAQQLFGVRHVYISTIYPAQHPQYTHELARLLSALPGAQSLSDLHKMSVALGGQESDAAELTRYEQSLVEQVSKSYAGRAQGRGTAGTSVVSEFTIDLSLTEPCFGHSTQELCATAHGFLGSGRSTWTGNVELQRASNSRPSMMFGEVR